MTFLRKLVLIGFVALCAAGYPVTPAITNFEGCTTGHRCLRGNFPVYAAVGDQMFQIQITNHHTSAVVVRIQTVSTYDFTYASFLDISMKSESTFVCNGSLSNLSDVGSILSNQTCQTHSNFETIGPGETRIHSVMSKITGLDSADTRSTSKYKIEVFSSQGYVTGQMIVSQGEGMVFAFVPAGGGAGTVRHTFAVPLNGGRPF